MAISKPHGNHKLKIYNRYTHKKDVKKKKMTTFQITPAVLRKKYQNIFYNCVGKKTNRLIIHIKKKKEIRHRVRCLEDTGGKSRKYNRGKVNAGRYQI